MVGENRVSLSHIDYTSGLRCVRPPSHDGAYIWSRYHTFAMWVFMENFIFSLLSACSLTSRATRIIIYSNHVVLRHLLAKKETKP